MADFVPVSVMGLDGISPVQEVNGLWRIWNINNIYVGQQGAGKYIPKVGDLVIDVKNWIWYEVTLIDSNTYISTLTAIDITENSGVISSTDILLGVGPGTQADTYRVYIDKSTIPYTLAVDARLKVAGTMCAYCKIFKGADLDNEANVISAIYDASNTFVGTTIPLELVAMDGNVSIKTVPVCNTKENLADNEVVTAVFYSNKGHVVSKRQLLVENTAFIRTTDTSVKYITGISLKSPFMSTSDVDMITYPFNVPVRSLNLMGVVEYSDGSTSTLPVDGTKFSIFGMDNFAATIIGQSMDIVLKYSLSSDEVCYGANHVGDRFITKTYKAKVIKADGAYTVKLYGYPSWNNSTGQYELEWYLMNMDRSILQYVTPYVRIESTQTPFKPALYGTQQALNVSVNLRDVNSSYTSYKHIQTENITLFANGTETGTKWTVGFDPDQKPVFGIDNTFTYDFVNENLKRLNISMGLSDQNEWLQRLYYNTRPLVNPYCESVAPVPNYFAVVIGNSRVEYSLDNWSNIITVGPELTPGKTVFIEFFKRTVANDIHLAIAGVPAIQN